MKIDYAKLGMDALARLRTTAGQPELIQTRLLQELLQKNSQTQYGRKYDFEHIHTVSDYQKKVPVSVYEDYEPYILRMTQGKEQELTHEAAAYFCITSGTTGEPKYVPLTEADLYLYYVYACGAVYGMAGEYYSQKSLDGGAKEQVFGKIFQLGEFARTYMDDGRLKGIRSASLYQWLDRDGQFDASDYCVPKEVLFPSDLEDLLYVKVRFALAEREIRAIHGVFVNRVVGVMDYICRNCDMLLHDIETGSVDERAALSDNWKAFVQEKLPPDPVRAKELRQVFQKGMPDEKQRLGMMKKIWPHIKYVQAIGGEAYAYYMERLKEYALGTPVHHFVYGASEGIFGVARQMDEPDAYILFPDAGFFEFMPLSGHMGDRPRLLWELNKGERYELVFTNHSGLYRYRMRDVIEVVDWYEKLPVIRFCYRKNLIINIAGEKSNVEQLEEAVRRFADQTDTVIIGYCVQEDVSGVQPRYLFYIESEGIVADGAEEILEKYLCLVNLEYQGCRSMNEIGPLSIEFLRPGSFGRYEKHLAAQGVSMGQNKLLRILDTEEKKQFFAGNRIGKERQSVTG